MNKLFVLTFIGAFCKTFSTLYLLQPSVCRLDKQNNQWYIYSLRSHQSSAFCAIICLAQLPCQAFAFKDGMCYLITSESGQPDVIGNVEAEIIVDKGDIRKTVHARFLFQGWSIHS